MSRAMIYYRANFLTNMEELMEQVFIVHASLNRKTVKHARKLV